MIQSHPAPRFIDDLVPLILESNDHWWPRDLFRLAQVSLAWLGPIRKRLYACPTLHSFRTCSQFARTLCQNPALLPLIRGIDLRPMLENCLSDRFQGSEDRSLLRFILGIEGLQRVTLGGQLAIRAERFLHLLTDSHTVSELHIDGSLLADSLTCRPSLEWDKDVAFKFPNLRTLQLTNLDLDIIYPSISYHLQITDLVLDNVDVTSGYLSHLLNETPSLSRLHVSTKSAAEFNDHIRLVLASCAVGNLEYEVQEDAPSRQLIFHIDSPRAPSLSRLHLNAVQVDLDILAAIDQCCQNLEELSVSGRMVSLVPHEWAAFLDSGALSSLRYLDLPRETYHPQFTQRCGVVSDPILEAACAQRNIRLKLI